MSDSEKSPSSPVEAHASFTHNIQHLIDDYIAQKKQVNNLLVMYRTISNPAKKARVANYANAMRKELKKKHAMLEEIYPHVLEIENNEINEKMDEGKALFDKGKIEEPKMVFGPIVQKMDVRYRDEKPSNIISLKKKIYTLRKDDKNSRPEEINILPRGELYYKNPVHAKVLGTASFAEDSSPESSPESKEYVGQSPTNNRKTRKMDKNIHNKIRNLLKNATAENPNLSSFTKQHFEYLPENEAIPIELADEEAKIYKSLKELSIRPEYQTPHFKEVLNGMKIQKIGTLRHNAKILEPIREKWPAYYKYYLTWNAFDNIDEILNNNPELSALNRVEQIATHYASQAPSSNYEIQSQHEYDRENAKAVEYTTWPLGRSPSRSPSVRRRRQSSPIIPRSPEGSPQFFEPSSPDEPPPSFVPRSPDEPPPLP